MATFLADYTPDRLISLLTSKSCCSGKKKKKVCQLKFCSPESCLPIPLLRLGKNVGNYKLIHGRLAADVLTASLMQNY